MSLPITIPYTFANATTSIPLANLDSDFTVVVNAINGIANGTNSLANVNIIGGTIDNVAIGATTPSNGTFTNLVATTSNVGTISTGTWNGSPIGVSYGGTNLTSYTVGDLVYASGATTLAKLADVATGSVLVSGGVGVAPSYSASPSVTSLTAPTIKSSSSLTIQTNGTTTAMTVDTSQNVAIGTTGTVAGAKFSVTQSATSTWTAFIQAANAYGAFGITNTSGTASYNAHVFFNNGTSFSPCGSINVTGTATYFNPNSTGNDYLSSAGTGTIIIGTGGSERMRIDSSGNLLVGKTSSTNSVGGLSLYNQGNAGRIDVANTSGTSQYGMGFYYGATPTNVGNITIGSSSTAYNTSSDYRLKYDVQPMTTGLSTVSALKPVTYKWNADNSDGEGFIAHELQSVIPHAVTGDKDAVDEEGNIKPQGVDYSKIVVHLVAAINELSAKNDALEARLAKLENVQ